MPQVNQQLSCDFCSAPGPTWLYPADAFTMAHPGDRTVMDYAPDWTACDACHELIEREDEEGLVRRCVETLLTAHGLWKSAGARGRREAAGYVRSLHREFWARRGPARRLTSEDGHRLLSMLAADAAQGRGGVPEQISPLRSTVCGLYLSVAAGRTPTLGSLVDTVAEALDGLGAELARATGDACYEVQVAEARVDLITRRAQAWDARQVLYGVNEATSVLEPYGRLQRHAALELRMLAERLRARGLVVEAPGWPGEPQQQAPTAPDVRLSVYFAPSRVLVKSLIGVGSLPAPDAIEVGTTAYDAARGRWGVKVAAIDYARSRPGAFVPWTGVAVSEEEWDAAGPRPPIFVEFARGPAGPAGETVAGEALIEALADELERTGIPGDGLGDWTVYRSRQPDRAPGAMAFLPHAGHFCRATLAEYERLVSRFVQRLNAVGVSALAVTRRTPPKALDRQCWRVFVDDSLAWTAEALEGCAVVPLAEFVARPWRIRPSAHPATRDSGRIPTVAQPRLEVFVAPAARLPGSARAEASRIAESLLAMSPKQFSGWLRGVRNLRWEVLARLDKLLDPAKTDRSRSRREQARIAEAHRRVRAVYGGIRVSDEARREAIIDEALIDTLERSPALRTLAESLPPGQLIVYRGATWAESFSLAVAPGTLGVADALAAALGLDRLALFPHLRPPEGGRFVPWRTVVGAAPATTLLPDESDLLSAFAEWAEGRLLSQRVRGPRGPHCYLRVDDPRLASAGVISFAFLEATMRRAIVRVDLDPPGGRSVRVVEVGSVAERIDAGKYEGDPLSMLLDCAALAALHDMTVADEGVLCERPAKAERAHAGEALASRSGEPPDAPRPVELVPIAYIRPKRGVEWGGAAGGGSARHRSPVPHQVTWYPRRLPAGAKASAAAQEKARAYQFRLPAGFTFVDAHISPRVPWSPDLPARELRSTHALGLLRTLRLHSMAGAG